MNKKEIDHNIIESSEASGSEVSGNEISGGAVSSGIDSVREASGSEVSGSEVSGSSRADLSEKTEESIRAESSDSTAKNTVDSITAEDSDPAAEERGDSIPAEDSDPSEEDGFGDGAGEPAENDAESKKDKKKRRKEDSRADGMDGMPPVRRSWFVKFLLCCVSFLAVFGIVNLAFYVLGMEPFGTKTAAIDDAKIQYIDFFTYYVDVLHGVRPLSYDFSNMMGGSSVGMFSYYLASPFNLLLYFFGKEGVYRFFDVAVALKLATAGATFNWYLQRRFANRIRPVFVIALSMGYALMSYQIAQSSNIMWLDGVYMLPLIMLGVYEVLHRKTVWRLVLAVAFCICCNWYIAGINCLFSGIWFLFEFFFQDDFIAEKKLAAPAVPDRRYSGSRRRATGPLLGITDFVVSGCRYGWGMGLGVALSSILFLPAVSAMRQGKGQFKNIEFEMKFLGDLLSSVRGYVIGYTGDTRQAGYAALFCGGIAVVTAAALIFSGSWKIRQKIAYLGLAGICFLMLYWQPATLIFSLLKRADSYWYRYSYLVCFALLFGAGAYLSRAERDRWSKIFLVLAALLYAAGVLKLNGIHFADFQAQGLALAQANKPVFATVCVSLVLTLLTLLLISVRPPEKGGLVSPRGIVRLAAGLLLLVAAGTELWANARMIWSRNYDQSQNLYLEYSEGLQEQLAQLRSVDGGYYRIAQDRTRWHYTDDDDLTAFFNDSLAQNYWSNTAYTSSPDKAQLDLMWRLGYRDEAGCMMIVRDPVIPSDSFLGVKYYLESMPVQGLEPVEGVKAFNGRKVYRNPYALPMAFVYDGSKLPTMEYNTTFAYQNALFSTLAGKDITLYTPLSWTRENKENMTYFSVYIPKGNYLAYGNLLWNEKKTGRMSVNGTQSFGYCRWMSPAAFLIRSREEQAQSTASESLQEIQEAQRKEKAKEKEKAKADADADAEEVPVTETVSVIEQERTELEEAAAAYDKDVLASLKSESYADVRTVVFRSDNPAPFKDYQFYGLNLDSLQEAVDTIRETAVPDESLTIENGYVTCSLTGRPGQSLCLLVPWSKGWKALRNGEIVQPDTVAGTMITIPLVNGQNTIELTYQPPFVREGMYISAGALAVLLIDILCRLIANRKKRKNRR